MALTVSVLQQSDESIGAVRLVELTFDSSYPVGGYSLSAASVNLRRIRQVNFEGPAVPADGTTAVPVRYNYGTGKVHTYESAATGLVLLEKGDTESLAGYTVRAIVIGRA